MCRAYLDTCCVIYLLEEVQGFSATLRAHLADNPEVILCVSPLVRLEVLIKPLVEANIALVKDYEDFLSAQQWLPMGDSEFDQATRLRAVHRLKTPDALHLATALRHNCAEFWTNDDRLNTAAAGMAVNLFSHLTRRR
jgi:predicted nucleic acid-binding protein